MRWKPLLVAASLAASIGIGSYDYLARLEVEARVDAELQEAKPRELRRILRENSATLLLVHPGAVQPHVDSLNYSGFVPGRQTVSPPRGAVGARKVGCSCTHPGEDAASKCRRAATSRRYFC
eukprot:COSAG02_NODE_3098_length_7378_cov_4.737189_8_plen_122_part_00